MSEKVCEICARLRSDAVQDALWDAIAEFEEMANPMEPHFQENADALRGLLGEEAA